MHNISKILVANRGEIAIRVLRAASELGIETVALYTYEDRYSLHRYKADEAYLIGSEDEPLKPYLDIEEIIKLAKRKNVDAIHPGYGFLSENVDFVRCCEKEGILFVGPASSVMEQLGNKVTAKRLAKELQIPVVEGTVEPLEQPSEAKQVAREIGYPVLVKAAAGGGGRGMRVVHSEAELKISFLEAQNEAERAFGSRKLFIEKFIEDPKHIEVQILGDSAGSIVHLFERDCSVQRRFQKVIEFAPSISLEESTKQLLYEAAIKISAHVGYVNAGTVEFLVDKEQNFYFIEVNPRIQVEHTVTEQVTGVDLVRAQILIAQGHPLSHPQICLPHQQAVRCAGYAIQCRITAENPVEDFRPDYGTIAAYRSPGGFGIRLDAGGAYQGAKISPFFDSLLVKVTGSGETLRGAAERLGRALREFRVRGVETNISFLENVIAHPTFLNGQATIHFVEQSPELFEFSPRRDRATKALRYLAEVIVNGNPDVKRIDSFRKFESPIVPLSEKYVLPGEGSRQKLQELGAEGFANWLRGSKDIQYTDTTLRDAHQSLLATRMRTIDMLNVTESYAKNFPQIFSLEVWGGATFDVSLRFLHECPWRRLKLLRERAPNICFQMLLRGSNAVGYSAYPDNLIIAFIEKAAEEGIDIFRIFDSMNWLEAMKVSIQAVRERTKSVAEASICYTGDILDPSRKKFTLEYYLNFAKKLEDEGAHIIAIKDMAGLLKPSAAELLIGKLKDTVQTPIHLHTHDTSSVQIATCLKAIDAGVDVVDVAIASFSGLTSQPNFNSLAAVLKNHERELPLNLSVLNQFSNYWERVRDYYYPFESELRAGTAEVYEHEIPGGQYSNLKPQARALGLEEKFEEIKTNYKAVNELLGDVIKVTPSSKVVGDFALFLTSNGLTVEDVLKRGEELSYPESLVSFFRGDLGQPYGGFPENLQRIVLKGERPFCDRPNDHIEPLDIKNEFQVFQKEFGEEQDFLDFLSFKLYPKVFRDYTEFQTFYGQIETIPTKAFFFGLEPDEEVLIDIAEGKTLIVRLVYVTKPNEEGIRTVTFNLNGQTRTVEVFDKSIEVHSVRHRKVETSDDIGSPLQGKLSQILVDVGQGVAKGEPLFVIEAMKMETTVSAPKDSIVRSLVLTPGIMVEAEDVILVLEEKPG